MKEKRERDRFENCIFNLVENLAYQKQTWTNVRNQKYRKQKIRSRFWSSRAETNADLSYVVDGLEDTSKCTTIDNHFVRKPVWMVDLGRKRNVAGVFLRTSSDNQFHLAQHSSTTVNRYNVYVDHYPRRQRFKSSNFCSSLIRIDQLLISSTRLHFQCQRPMHGRYVYLESVAAGNHWNKSFTARLCEVFVYEQ